MLASELNKNPSISHSDILKTICSPLRELGINFFAYTGIDKNGNAYCLGSKPGYAAEYLKRNHAQNDIHYSPEKASKKYHYNFWDFIDLNKEMEELYRMAAAFDQGHTLTVSQHSNDMTHSFHFSGHISDIGMNQRYLDKLDSLHAFILYFKHCLQSIPEISAVYQHPVLISPIRKPNNQPVSVSSDPRLATFIENIKDPIYFKKQNQYFLSENELNCLKWLKLGKSAAMIARINGVSYKTIERYIESCKQKKQCYTLFQLGEKIARDGLSHFIDLLSKF